MMPDHNTADARAALMATYLARHTYSQAGVRPTPLSSSTPPLGRYDGNVSHRRLQKSQKELSLGGFAARGRTIYNANWTPDPVTPSTTKKLQGQPCSEQYSALAELRRIDAEEEQRKTLRYEFLMAARGDFEVQSLGQEGQGYGWEDEQRAQEMFDLYIRMEE